MKLKQPGDNVGNTSNYEAEEHIKNTNPLSRYFWKSIDENIFIPIPDSEVELAVERFMDSRPISTLTEQELAAIKDSLINHFKFVVAQRNKEAQSLIEKKLYLVPIDFYKKKERSGSSSEQAIYIKDDIDSELEDEGFAPMTKEEKKDKFSEPLFWDNTTFIENVKGGVSVSHSRFVPGSRSLYEYSYRDKDVFLNYVNDIKKSTGHEKIRMMDVGGNVGRALNDAKEVDPTIETFNMTLDEPPVVCGDHIVRHPAELMPEEFLENIDIIESNVAFRYFTYQDIALKNIIKALSVGGRASIDFQADRTNTKSAELIPRFDELFKLIKQLEDDGYISVEYGKLSRLYVESGIPWYVQTIYTGPRQLKITKNKSIRDLNF